MNCSRETSKVIAVDRQEEFVLRTLEERDIRFVRLWFTDVLGALKSVAVAQGVLVHLFLVLAKDLPCPIRRREPSGDSTRREGGTSSP